MRTFWITWQSSPTRADACVLDTCCAKHALAMAITVGLVPMEAFVDDAVRIFELDGEMCFDLPRGRLLTETELRANGVFCGGDPNLN